MREVNGKRRESKTTVICKSVDAKVVNDNDAETKGIFNEAVSGEAIVCDGIGEKKTNESEENEVGTSRMIKSVKRQ